jgi:hypothetical protein
MCLVLCKALEVLTEFLGQNRGQMGKIVDKKFSRSGLARARHGAEGTHGLSVPTHIFNT